MGKVINIKIDSEMHGHRIEYILEKRLSISSSLIKRLKRAHDGVLLNGVRVTVITKVSQGDELQVNIEGKEAENITPVNIPLDIIFEDDDILVVNKSGSMPVHPSRIHKNDTLANAVMYHIGTGKAIHIITRLDRETSGIVLVAKNPRAAAILTDEMKNGKIKKEYIAVVNGILKDKKGTISAPIKKKDCSGILRCVSDDGKDAVTNYETMEKAETLSLVKLFPLTGRTHQIRVHMSYIGNPIFGDSMYGAPQREGRCLLHCHKLVFTHPVTNDEVSFVTPIPEDFKAHCTNVLNCEESIDNK